MIGNEACNGMYTCAWNSGESIGNQSVCIIGTVAWKLLNASDLGSFTNLICAISLCFSFLFM